MMAAINMKTQLKISCLWLLIIVFSLSSCGPFIQGRINSFTNGTPSNQATFFVKQDHAESLTEKHIKDLISKEMENLGFTPTSSREEANYLVGYRLNVGSGVTNITSSPDLAGGGHNVSSETSYSREFVIVIVGKVFGEKLNGSPGILWKAELFSRGTLTDRSELADYFIPQMFQLYGKTASNEKFKVPIN